MPTYILLTKRSPENIGQLRSAVVSGPHFLEELDQAADLIQSIHLVLDGDPSAEADSGKDTEDRAVVVEALVFILFQCKDVGTVRQRGYQSRIPFIFKGL